MKFKIVSDSASDLLTLDQVPYTNVPLHIRVGEQEFVDDKDLDTTLMQAALETFDGKTSTACPAPGDWIDAFGEAETVYVITITGALSGSNASAHVAKQMYEDAHPDRKVYVYDSLSTGPEMILFIQKVKTLILSGMSAEEIAEAAAAYQKTTHLLFALASLNNLARNGRVNPLVAKGIGLLGLRIIGTASEEGTLHPMDKARGDRKAIPSLVSHMLKTGYTDGRIIISHNNNAIGAESLKNNILDTVPGFRGEIEIYQTRGLCSYYAEPGSLLLAFETPV